MDSLVQIKLIKEEIVQGDLNQEITIESSRNVMGQTHGISRNEWATAGARGINASMRVDIYDFEYSGELVAEVLGTRYGIYRTFNRFEESIVELYLHQKGGLL